MAKTLLGIAGVLVMLYGGNALLVQTMPWNLAFALIVIGFAFGLLLLTDNHPKER